VAHSLSAQKRVRQDAKKRMINRSRKSAVKTDIKKLELAVKEGNVEKAQAQLKAAQIEIDKVSSTSTMHKNTAARLKSRLTKKFNALKTK
jgi:small subunit ribosomal protein S20